MLKYLREGRLENETGVCKCEVHEQREVKTPDRVLPLSKLPGTAIRIDRYMNSLMMTHPLPLSISVSNSHVYKIPGNVSRTVLVCVC